MKATLTHVQAACHWLMTPIDGRALASLPRSSILGRCPTRASDLLRTDFASCNIEGVQTEFLVTDSSACPRPQLYRYHTSCREFPHDAFVVLDTRLQIVSPELSFWQMADVLPLGELVKYGNALCARHSYAVDPDGRLGQRRIPLTTRARLEAFAREMGTPRAHPNVFRALRAVVDNCESPMESAISVLACLKRQYGGFGMPKPVMGYVIELDRVARDIAGTDTCRCDMFWPDAGYDLEYDSDQEHLGDAVARDAARRMAIRHMGVRVEELRRSQVVDAEMFKIAVGVVAEGIGWRIRRRSPEDELRHDWRYTELRRQLFHWERKAAGEEPSPLRVSGLDW